LSWRGNEGFYSSYEKPKGSELSADEHYIPQTRNVSKEDKVILAQTKNADTLVVM
jgi:hypothetical protein